MSDKTRIPTFDQGEEVQRSASPIATDDSISSAMPSQGPGRKRTNDEMYKTGGFLNQSNKLSLMHRQKTATEQNQKASQPSQPEEQGCPKDAFEPVSQSFDSTVTTLSTQPSDVTTSATAPDPPQTFVSRLQELQTQLNLEYDQYEQDLEKRDHKAQIEPYDWDSLERRYLEEIEPAIKSEQDIQTRLGERYGSMLLWMQASSDRETHRAIKRLRTRVAFVQNSEAKLVEKEQHYEKVLKAFQSTMALLGGA